MQGHPVLRSIVVLLGLLMAAPASSNTLSSNVMAQVRSPEKIGEAQVRFLGFRVYSAALFTQQGRAFNWKRPFALTLDYDRSFSKKRLIDASISEMERMEGDRPDHAAIAAKLENCFRSVKASDRFTATATSRNSVNFYFNGRQTCKISHAGIRERLLGIWLSDQSRDKSLSRRLRGMN
ncbi:Chalcone isomerase-like [Cohaesibacter sp. ES.047]|uniref:chalcone isomerase family protein n=1 Tax=Cohaesibacter sp. ES.047 TaxID=1798205 RepID=UPI000BBFE958|nr:chalcone isomerase family protein [Cohaesibacter sp. ES.047]SNY92224.1 Chalcone isomerase-like [Cohaesibacter sp. ES.047]